MTRIFETEKYVALNRACYIHVAVRVSEIPDFTLLSMRVHRDVGGHGRIF